MADPIKKSIGSIATQMQKSGWSTADILVTLSCCELMHVGVNEIAKMLKESSTKSIVRWWAKENISAGAALETLHNKAEIRMLDIAHEAVDNILAKLQAVGAAKHSHTLLSNEINPVRDKAHKIPDEEKRIYEQFSRALALLHEHAENAIKSGDLPNASYQQKNKELEAKLNQSILAVDQYKADLIKTRTMLQDAYKKVFNALPDALKIGIPKELPLTATATTTIPITPSNP